MRRSVRYLALLLGWVLAGVSRLEGQTPIPTPIASLPDSARAALERLQQAGDLGPIGLANGAFLGGAVIGSRDTVRGSLLSYGGRLVIEGVVDGSVAAVDGDVVVGRSAVITGSVGAVGGIVHLNGGTIAGEIRSGTQATSGLSGAAVAAADAVRRAVQTDAASERREPRTPLSPWQTARLVAGFLALFAVLGIGVLLFAPEALDGVVRALEDRFSRALLIGIMAQFAMLPVLLLVVTALAVSVVGILLIPFAVVAYVVAAVGLLALGFLAAVRLTGGVFGTRPAAPRAAHLRGMVIGLALYFGLWLAAAAMSWHPVAGLAIRGVAVAFTWVAMTVGLGGIALAALAARRTRAEAHLPRAHGDAVAWMTPTPITGVVAARRPAAASSAS